MYIKKSNNTVIKGNNSLEKEKRGYTVLMSYFSVEKGRKCLFKLMRSTHFIYSYMVFDPLVHFF